jgi:tetratricopeptide (TPR) repeat protein
LEWKTRGDAHFCDKEYIPAVVAYSRGLKIEPTLTSLLLNRCISHLRLDNHAAALWDAEQAANSPATSRPDKIKALFRAGQAKYGMSHYDAAEAYYGRCLELYPDLVDARAGTDRCTMRRKECEGQFDWLALFETSQSPSSRIDVAEFVGPIEVITVPGCGGGRGVIATRDIEVGELLVSDTSLSDWLLALIQWLLQGCF